MDLRNQKINYKIREHSLAKVPMILVCGKKEVSENTVTVRRLGSEKQEVFKREELIKNILIANKLPLNFFAAAISIAGIVMVITSIIRYFELNKPTNTDGSLNTNNPK